MIEMREKLKEFFFWSFGFFFRINGLEEVSMRLGWGLGGKLELFGDFFKVSYVIFFFGGFDSLDWIIVYSGVLLK